MGIYQHYRQEEHIFIDQVLSWRTAVEKTYVPKLTDFLDPREQQIIKSIIGSANEELRVSQFGGSESAERKRVIISPFYDKINNNSFQIVAMEASFHSKFISLSHRDVMGAYLSLGLQRSTLGDIYVEEDGKVQILMAEEIAPYVIANLTTIKNANVKLREIPFSSIQSRNENWLKKHLTVSSLRLDTVIKEIYNVSRKTAADFILKNEVKVNFKTVTDLKFTLREGDLLSVRGRGRSKLVEINGHTRRGNMRIIAAQLK